MLDAKALTALLTGSVKVPSLDRQILHFDLPGKTNDLISRSVFGGTLDHDKDNYSRQIAADNKSILSTLQRIESMVSGFGNF